MLNDIGTPPPEPSEPNGHNEPSGPADLSADVGMTKPGHRPRNPLVKPHAHIQPHVDDRLPGRHKPRVMGEPETTDAVYAMPMEDRGSAFSLGLSAVVVVLVFIALLIVWASLYR